MKKLLSLSLALLLGIIAITAHTASAKLSVKYTKKATILRHIPLPQVPDCTVLQKRLIGSSERFYYQDDRAIGIAEESLSLDTAGNQGAPAPASKALSTSDGGSPDFSTTNIQVEGVDEADVVKNDGKYIYLVKGGTVRIVQAFPPSQLSEIAIIEDDEENFTAQELFITDDRLVIIGNTYESYSKARPYRWGGNLTKVIVVDTSNKEDIKELRSIEFEGNYFTSRRIGNQVYFVLQQYPNFYPYSRVDDREESDGIVPLMTDSLTGETTPIAPCNDIAIFPGYRSPNFLIAASIDLNNTNKEVVRKAYLGSTDNVYVSPDNLYVTMTAYPRFDFIAQILPRDVFESTLVYKFHLDNGNIDYKGAGEVPGTILNQFSMDEYNGNFRITTTKRDNESGTTNNLYILDSTLERVGEIEDIAPGERIFSTRFIGDRAYMVTFRQVDPLFVIDVKDPTNPKILGKLKIPGFSDYLHPYDANHIIGFGKDTEESKDGSFAWIQGMKIALFDVSDVENPKEKFKVIIGDRGTDSELLRNHKALLFSKEKNLLAFPITIAEIPQETKNDPEQSRWAYGEQVFQGLQVYSLNLINGFQLKGQITHQTDEDILKSGYYIGNYRNNVKRGLYIGDHLYTISENKVKANILSNLKQIKEIELKPGKDDNGDYPYPEPFPIEILR